jgi:hypothetical protein
MLTDLADLLVDAIVVRGETLWSDRPFRVSDLVNSTKPRPTFLEKVESEGRFRPAAVGGEAI